VPHEVQGSRSSVVTAIDVRSNSSKLGEGYLNNSCLCGSPSAVSVAAEPELAGQAPGAQT